MLFGNLSRGRMFLVKSRKLATVIFFLAIGGCVGPRVVKVQAPQDVNFSIPDDLAKAFEVKDTLGDLNLTASQALLLPRMLTSESPRKELKKSLKKKNEIKVAKKSKHKQNQEVKPENISGTMSMPLLDGLEIPNRRPESDPVWVGEKITMDVTWLNTTAGEFLMEVLPHKFIKGRKVYSLKGTARTSKLFALVYKADDTVQSFVDYIGWFPYKFELLGDESKHKRRGLELFDHVAGKQYVWNYDYRIPQNEVHENKDVKPLTRFTQDSLSALYFIRIHDLRVGKVIKFPMTTGGDQWETEVSILKHEDLKTPMGIRSALKTKVETRFNGALRQQGDAFIWFSDDFHRYPLRFEAKVKIGWVAGITKAIEPGDQDSTNTAGL